MSTEIKAAAAQDVQVYLPYYKEAKRVALPYAITLFKQGVLQGERQIEGGPPVSFTANWKPSNLPLDLITCRVVFEGDADYAYELVMANSVFVEYLIEIVATLRDKGVADFPQVFYEKLFRMKIATTDSF